MELYVCLELFCDPRFNPLTSGGFRESALGAEASPLKCISPWPIAYVAKLRNKSNYYSLFGDTDLAQQTGHPTQQCFKRFISVLCTSVLFNASQCLD